MFIYVYLSLCHFTSRNLLDLCCEIALCKVLATPRRQLKKLSAAGLRVRQRKRCGLNLGRLGLVIGGYTIYQLNVLGSRSCVFTSVQYSLQGCTQKACFDQVGAMTDLVLVLVAEVGIRASRRLAQLLAPCHLIAFGSENGIMSYYYFRAFDRGAGLLTETTFFPSWRLFATWGPCWRRRSKCAQLLCW